MAFGGYGDMSRKFEVRTDLTNTSGWFLLVSDDENRSVQYLRSTKIPLFTIDVTLCQDLVLLILETVSSASDLLQCAPIAIFTSRGGASSRLRIC